MALKKKNNLSLDDLEGDIDINGTEELKEFLEILILEIKTLKYNQKVIISSLKDRGFIRDKE